MENFIKNFAKVYRMICVIILTLMVVIVFVNAVCRYAFNSGFIATEEILRYLFIYMTFLGVVEVACVRGHISVTVLTDFLPRRIRTVVYLLGYFLILYAMWVLFDGSLMFYEESETSVGQVTGLPYRVIIASIIFAAAGVALFTVRDIFCAVKALRTGEDFPPALVDEDVEAAKAVLKDDEETK